MRLVASSTIFVLTLVLLLAACSFSPGPAVVELQNSHPLPGKARVVMYYPPPIAGSNGMIQVTVDKKDSCNLDVGTFVVREIAPGLQKMEFSFCGIRGPSHFSLKAEAGKTYYLRILPYDSSVRGILAGYPSEYDDKGEALELGPIKIEQIEEQEALKAIDSLSPMPLQP